MAEAAKTRTATESNDNMDRNDIQTLTTEATALLKEMIAIPSPSFSEGEVCSYISNWLTGKGLVHERVGNNIIATLSQQPGINSGTFEGKPTLMLCAHIDTVAPCEGYSFDPYKPDYAKAAESIGCEEIIAGLGSNDDGASVVSSPDIDIALSSYTAFTWG